MRVTKVQRKKDVLKVWWEEKRGGGQEGWNSFALASEDMPRGELHDALNALVQPVAKVLGLPEKWMLMAVVVGVKMIYSETGEAKMVTVSLKRPLGEAVEGAVLALTTPAIVSEKFEPALGTVEAECERYVRGDRRQGVLIPEEQPGETEKNDLLEQAKTIVRDTGRASTASLQRRMRIGFGQAAELMEKLEKAGIVGPPSADGGAREVLFGDGKREPASPGEAPDAADGNAPAATAATERRTKRDGRGKHAA